MGLDDADGLTAQDSGSRVGLFSGGSVEAKSCASVLFGHRRLTMIAKKIAALKPPEANERRFAGGIMGLNSLEK